MLSTQAFAILAALAGSTLVSAHGHVASWTVNGVKKAGFNPSYAAAYGSTAERPTDNSDQGFADHTTGIVACGGLKAGSGLETWDLDAGSTVTAHWNTWPDSHKGPVTEYMAKCPGTSCDGVAADSLDWFKISERNWDGSKWPTEAIVTSLASSFKIPSDLAPGAYLVRHDLLAMHTVGGPQVYPVCFQANLKSTGSAVPGNTVKFPAAYNMNDMFKTFSIYGGNNGDFVPPGPPVYSGGGGGAAPPPAPAPSTPAPAPSSSASSAAPSSSAAPAPSSSAAPAPSSSTVPVPDDEYPEPSTEAPPPAPSTTVPAPVPTTKPTTPAPPPTSGGAMGGPAPPVKQVGTRFEVNGGSYHDEVSARWASCYYQMNKCKDWSNTLPNAEVSAAQRLCDAQLATCGDGVARKRDVIARYAKRGLQLF